MFDSNALLIDLRDNSDRRHYALTFRARSIAESADGQTYVIGFAADDKPAIFAASCQEGFDAHERAQEIAPDHALLLHETCIAPNEEGLAYLRYSRPDWSIVSVRPANA